MFFPGEGRRRRRFVRNKWTGFDCRMLSFFLHQSKQGVHTKIEKHGDIAFDMIAVFVNLLIQSGVNWISDHSDKTDVRKCMFYVAYPFLDLESI